MIRSNTLIIILILILLLIFCIILYIIYRFQKDNFLLGECHDLPQSSLSFTGNDFNCQINICKYIRASSQTLCKLLNQSINNTKYTLKESDAVSFKQYEWVWFTPTKPKSRKTYIAIPTKSLPKNGFPFVLYFQPEGDEGILPSISSPGEHDKDPSLKKTLIKLCELGIAVVMVLVDPNAPYGDTYYIMEDGGGYNWNPQKKEYSDKCPYDNESIYTCWNSPNGKLEKQYLEDLFTYLSTNKSIDLSKMVLLGYSAGSQMVSLAIDQFPSLKYDNNNKNFPTILAGVMIAGGSQYCYAYNTDIHDTKSLPVPFKNCPDPVCRFCCPENITEKRFLTKAVGGSGDSYSKHPPMLLCQTINDKYADTHAAFNYYETMIKNNGEAAIVIGDGNNHGLISCQISPVLAFISYYIL